MCPQMVGRILRARKEKGSHQTPSVLGQLLLEATAFPRKPLGAQSHSTLKIFPCPKTFGHRWNYCITGQFLHLFYTLCLVKQHAERSQRYPRRQKESVASSSAWGNLSKDLSPSPAQPQGPCLLPQAASPSSPSSGQCWF